MKSILLSAVALSFAVSVLAEEKPPQLKELKDKASYAIGLNVGFNFKRQNVDVNQDAFTAGFKDALSGRKPLMSEQEVRDTMMAFEKDMQQKLTETAQKNEIGRASCRERVEKREGEEGGKEKER